MALSGFASVLCETGLYAYNGISKSHLTLPNDDSEIGYQELVNGLAERGFTTHDLQFNGVADPKTILRMPLKFFQDDLTPTQLEQMVVNSNTKTLFSKEFLYKASRKSALKTKISNVSKANVRQFLSSIKKSIADKLDAIYSKLKSLTVALLGVGRRAERVMENIAVTLYRYVSPTLAFSCKAFKKTLKGIARIFDISLQVLINYSYELVKMTISMIGSILTLLATFNPAFGIASFLFNLIAANPIMEALIGKTARLMLQELDGLVQHVEGSAEEAKKSIAKNKSNIVALQKTLQTHHITDAERPIIDLLSLPSANLKKTQKSSLIPTASDKKKRSRKSSSKKIAKLDDQSW